MFPGLPRFFSEIDQRIGRKLTRKIVDDSPDVLFYKNRDPRYILVIVDVFPRNSRKWVALFHENWLAWPLTWGMQGRRGGRLQTNRKFVILEHQNANFKHPGSITRASNDFQEFLLVPFSSNHQAEKPECL